MVAQKVISGIYDGVSTAELDELAVGTAANMVTTHPDYDTLAARLAASILHKETSASFAETMERLYTRLDSFGSPAPVLADDIIAVIRENADAIDAEIAHERDFTFDYWASAP